MGEGVSSHPVFTESAGKCAPKNSLTYILKKKPVFYAETTRDGCKAQCYKEYECDAYEWNPESTTAKCRVLFGKGDIKVDASGNSAGGQPGSGAAEGPTCTVKDWKLLEEGVKGVQGTITPSAFNTEFRQMAGLEYIARMEAKGKDIDINTVPMVGNIECFCDFEQKRYGLSSYILKKKFDDKYDFTDSDAGTHNEPLCEAYFWSKKYAEVLGRAVQYSIIVLNTVIRMIVIKSINWVGCDDQSNQMQHITNVVFLCQFFNTGCLLMLCNANFAGQGFFFGSAFKGYDSDFNTNWFEAFGGTIIGAMTFNVWFPFVGEMI